MSGKRITRTQAERNSDLKREIEEFNPFVPKKELSRGEDDHSFNISAFSGTSTEPLNNSSNLSQGNFADSNLIDVSVLSNNTTKILIDLDNSYLNNTLENKMASPNEERPQPQIPQVTQVVSLRDAIMVIPEFTGKNIPLGQFLEGCNEAKEMVEPAFEANLVKLIRSKVLGEARQAISGHSFATVEEIKDFMKNIYAPEKTTTQLLGELGNEFQHDDENVISFANRIRDIGSKILDAKRISNNGQIPVAYRNSIETTLVDCFKRGLKLEIEQRLLTGEDENNDVNDIVKNAIAIERQLAARRDLRKIDQPKFDGNQLKNRRIFSCTICSKVGHEAGNCRNKLWCQHCKITGHTTESCFKVSKNYTQNNTPCQLCNKNGHTANQCHSFQECQICKRKGHSAKNCFKIKDNNQCRIICQYCDKPGHTADNCFLLKPKIQSANKIEVQLTCQLCQRNGHTANSCRKRSTEVKECRYCKTKGHIIEECRERIYNEERRAGNEQNLPGTSAAREIAARHQRSIIQKPMTNLLEELIPSV